jgi:tetratricopeptide (TPR) repeat protein
VCNYRRAIHLARQADDRFTLGRACTNLGYYYIEHESQHWQRAEVLCCYALNLFTALDNKHGLAHTANHLGILYTHQERWAEALTQLHHACSLWETKGDEHGLMYGRCNLGGVLHDMGHFVEALEQLQAAVALAKATGEESFKGTIYMNLGNTLRLQGQMTEAETYYAQAKTIFQRDANRYGLALLAGNQGLNYILQHQWLAAERALTVALHSWQQLGDPYGQLQAKLDWAEYALARGDEAQLLTWLQQVEEQLQYTTNQGWYRRLMRQAQKLRQKLSTLRG